MIDVNRFIEEKIIWPITDVFDKLKCFLGLHDYIHDLTQYDAVSKMLLLLCKLKVSDLRGKIFEVAMEKCNYACLWCDKKKREQND